MSSTGKTVQMQGSQKWPQLNPLPLILCEGEDLGQHHWPARIGHESSTFQHSGQYDLRSKPPRQVRSAQPLWPPLREGGKDFSLASETGAERGSNEEPPWEWEEQSLALKQPLHLHLDLLCLLQSFLHQQEGNKSCHHLKQEIKDFYTWL